MQAKIDSVEERPVPSEQVARQIERVLRSTAFHGSEILRHLLDYLAACSLEGRAEDLKVKEIARNVFGRSESFDSQSDSVVRVHTGRLRSKLAEYYIDEGAHDDLIISIPKGSYGVSWHPRAAAPAHLSPVPSSAMPVQVAVSSPAAPFLDSRPWLRRPNLLIWSLLLVAASSLLTWTFLRWSSSRDSIARRQPALSTFWQPFVADAEAPLIVFSNFRLVGSLETSVRAYRAESDGPPSSIIDSYTTVGEVMGVFDVTRTLSLFGQTARAKHGQLLTWDEAKDCNLIFVGGPLADTPLKTLSALHELQFKKALPGMSPQGAAIANLHPRPGEQPLYFGPESRPILYDYAIIAFRPVFNRNRRTLILAGITEYGTQGAAEFVTREEHVAELLARLHVKSKDALPPFEALIRVKIEGGVPVQYELLLAHLAS